MADIRALMAQERQSRRINHEYATYTKSGVLMCTACQLNIKSETLWEGHLRSANHKANVKKTHEAQRLVAKRKLEDVDDVQASEDVDTRKKLKPKSRTPSEILNTSLNEQDTVAAEQKQDDIQVETVAPQSKDSPAQPSKTYTVPIDAARSAPTNASSVQVDEDEWAAFERDIGPLAQQNYSAATITAAPVSAAQLQAEAELDRKRLRDTEAEDEKEDEGRRIEEEFDIMDEMEERVRKLKEKRETLRSLGQSNVAAGQRTDNVDTEQDTMPDNENAKEESEIDAESDSEDNFDDWYS